MKVAVIPARGGSKRIPGKNIKLFAGKPMIAYSIECARRSGLFDRVIVSTDDEKIARVAQDLGAEAPFLRPSDLSDDYADTTSVIGHATEFLQAQGSKLAAVCCIYATAPFVRREDLTRALALLEDGEWQFVFSATTFAAPIFRAFRQNEQQGLEMFFPEYFTSRSQDLPEAIHDAGQFYWGRPQAWLDRLKIYDRHSTVVKIPRWRSQDIDTEEDWLQAEAMMTYLSHYAPPDSH